MVRIELTIDVARTAEEVFEHLIDLDRLPEWQASAVGVGQAATGCRHWTADGSAEEILAHRQ